MTSFTIRDVDPSADGPLLHQWVSAPRAGYWGMTECTLEQVIEIYQYLSEQPHVRTFFVQLNGEPLALFHSYDPQVDEIGQFYQREEGDLGLHLFMADSPRRAGRGQELLAFAAETLLADPQVQRIVFEPDLRNTKSHALIEAVGGVKGPQVHLKLSYAEKDAQFYFISRENAVSAAAAAAASALR